MSALLQLGTLNRGELTVLAAAAQALAQTLAQAPATPPQPEPSPAGPAGPAREKSSPPACGGRGRRRSLRRPDPSDALDQDAMPRHRRGCRVIGRKAVNGTAIALGAGAAWSAVGGTAERGADGLRLGGRGRLIARAEPLVDPELFASQAYRSRLGELGPSVPGLLYAAGCPGLLALARHLDEPLYKVGTTGKLRTADRMSMLGATRYGSVVRDGTGWREETGFEHWRAEALPLTRARGPGSPVRPALKAISYQRPASLSHRALDRAVAAMLAPTGLAAFAASPEGGAACRERALDPAALDRYSPAPLGCPQGRTEQAQELVLLGPRADADRLAAVLELIIAAHVMGWTIEGGMPTPRAAGSRS